MEFYLKGRNQGAFQEQYSRKMKQAWGGARPVAPEQLTCMAGLNASFLSAFCIYLYLFIEHVFSAR